MSKILLTLFVLVICYASFNELLGVGNVWQVTGFECAQKAGCYNKKCWTYCGSSENSGPWCYTTRGQSKDGFIVPCTKDSDCGECWKCAGSCST